MGTALELPLEELLCLGGDTRLEIDPRSGRNKYAGEPRPGRAVAFGSCTSSTITARGFAAAGEIQRYLRGASDPAGAAAQYAETIRQRLREMLTLRDDVDIVLGPSGTDVEMLALALAAGGGARPVMNILVGPEEVGSGTPQAAACRHYDTITPSGRRVVANEPIDRALASRVSVRPVGLRAASGEMLPESEIDAAVIELVLEAGERNAAVLLHIVAHSKTGVHAPSLACAERLRSANDDVVIVVDAAQGRFSRRGLREALGRDYLVIFTGSKFYGGPPFSGALLVPPKYRPRNRRLEGWPVGFGNYFTAAEMPRGWSEARQDLPRTPNYGGLVRWAAALAEMEAYYSVPSELRLRVLRFFEAEVPKVLGESGVIRMLPVFPPLYDDSAERLLESKTTVFGFWVTPPGGRKPLGKAALKQMHLELTTDQSQARGAIVKDGADRAALSREFHLGQPVDLGPAGAILRVALGGALVSRVGMDASIGATMDDRLAWLREQLVALRRKIECLARAQGPSPAAVLTFEVDQAALRSGPLAAL